MTAQLRLLLLTFVILNSSVVILPAAPPPELTVLRQQYDKAYAKRVTAVFDASKAALDDKFTTALDNAISTAKASGDLPAVLAIQEDKKAIEAKQDLPADTDTTPAALKTLRTIYREQVGKLTEQRTANTAALLTPYAAKLQQLEATLTKNDRVEEAKEVMDYRVGLKADAPAPLAAMTTSTPATPPTALPVPAQATKVKGDDRKAAEWVLGLGGTVTLKQPRVEVSDAADLPIGRFEVLALRFDNNQGKIPAIPDEAWAAIAGLQSLEFINVEGVKMSTPSFEHISTCSSLNQIQIQYSLLDDDFWPYLARLPKLTKLSLSYNSNLKGIGMSKAALPELESLLLSNRDVKDAAMPEIAAFRNLQELSMDGAQVTDEGISVLATLSKLKTLNLIHTPITSQGLAKLKTLPITRLGFGRTLSEMTTQLPEAAQLFPKLERLILPRDCNPTTEEVHVIAKAVPDLLQIECRTHNCDDTGAAALAQLTKLETLDLQYAQVTDVGIASFATMKKLTALRLADAKATDACFDSLAKLKTLKILRLPKPGNGITADGLAKFKKQRPDVKVE
jgi:Leucine-rich repeat (LRR) protein